MSSTFNGSGFENQSIVDHFADELWLSIFSLLDLKTRVRCSHVCKRWRSLALIDVKKVVFVSMDYKDDDMEFINYCSVIKVKTYLHIALIAKLFRKAYTVCFIGFREPNIDDDINENTSLKNLLLEIGNSFDCIRRFKTSKCMWNHQVIPILLDKHRNLERITIHKCYIQKELDDYLCQNFPLINSFIYKSLYELTVDVERFENLDKQKLRQFCYSSYETNRQLMDSLVKTSADSLELLTLPQIFWVDSLTFLYKFLNLKDLRLYLHMIAEDWWPYIILPNLEVFQLVGCCTSFNETAFVTAIKHSPKLKVIDLQLNEMSAIQWDIGDKSISNIVLYCSQLQILCLSCAPSITKESLDNLSSLRCLEQLQISYPEWITDRELAEFITKSKSIRVLGIESKVPFDITFNALIEKVKQNLYVKYYARFNCLKETENNIPTNLTLSLDKNIKEDKLWGKYFIINKSNDNTNYFKWKKH